jgi:hypothetical protein
VEQQKEKKREEEGRKGKRIKEKGENVKIKGQQHAPFMRDGTQEARRQTKRAR